MMKYLFILLLSLFLVTNDSFGQLVITVAGIVEEEGAIDGPAFEATFNNPHGIAADAEGNIYIADRFGHRIRRLSVDGQVTTIAGTGFAGAANGIGISASFNEPWGICVGNDGNVYVADTRNNLIRKITPDGVVSTLAGSGNYGTSDGFSSFATFGNPTGIEMDEEGAIYVADHLTHLIRKIDPNGYVSTLAGKAYTPGALDGTGTNAMFYRPYGLTIDNEGNILVADEWNHLIRKVTPEGDVTTIAGTGVIGNNNGPGQVSTFNYPWDITVDSVGQIFVADGYNQVLRKIEPSPAAPTTYSVSNFAGTLGISGGQDGYGSAATFNGATGITYVKSTGEFYVADAYNNLIRKLINLQTQAVGILITSDAGPTMCAGDLLEAQAIPDNFNAYTFYIDGEPGQTSTNPDFSMLDLPAGNHSLQVLVTDVTGSYFSNPIDVVVFPTPEPTITTIGDPTFYVGDSVILLANGGVDFLWSNGATTQTTTVLEGGTYTVEVTDENGCMGISEGQLVEVLQFSDAPVVSFLEGDNILCYNERGVLKSTYSTNNQWFLDGWPINGAVGNTLDINVAGTYQVQATDSLGFNLISNEVDVQILPPFLEDFNADRVTLNVEDNIVQFEAATSEPVEYYWDFGDPASGNNNFSTLENPTHTYFTTGMYTVSLVATSSASCQDTIIKTNYIELRELDPEPAPLDSIIYIPNAFTPNGDEVNDVFRVRGEGITGLNLQIYNQWGELIFTADNPTDGWDGKRGAKQAQMGTYTYMAKVILNTGQEEIRSGHVSLIR